MDQVWQVLAAGAGILWKALWVLVCGHVISACIQVVVTRVQTARTLGGRSVHQVALAGFFASFAAFGAIPEQRPELRGMVRFTVDHILLLNVAFPALSGWLVWRQSGRGGRHRQRQAAHAHT